MRGDYAVQRKRGGVQARGLMVHPLLLEITAVETFSHRSIIGALQGRAEEGVLVFLCDPAFKVVHEVMSVRIGRGGSWGEDGRESIATVVAAAAVAATAAIATVLYLRCKRVLEDLVTITCVNKESNHS